ncbi:MAG: ferritin-like domain-containing protein [Polyangiaceae bacterium]
MSTRILRYHHHLLLGALGLLAVGACSSGPPGVPCSDSSPVIIEGQDSGFATCGEGYVHRPASRACPLLIPRDTACTDDSGAQACTTDSDCTERPRGHCSVGRDGLCGCQYGCEKDTDCGDRNIICVCGDVAGECVASNCITDTDCGGDLLCSEHRDSCGQLTFRCQSPDDQCQTAADCSSGTECLMVADEALVCSEVICAIGRPFLVHDVSVLAPSATRVDWTTLADDLQPSLEGLSSDQRRQLADHYTTIGLMEHASVAAFARFTLQLLAQGAPADLVEQSGQAMSDEIEHARIAFALATAYGAEPVGPAALDTRGALDDLSPEEILRMVVLEGCIGETVAAVDAAEVAAEAVDPVVAAVLERIAHDEARHAALAWRYVAWRLSHGEAIDPTCLTSSIAAARLDAARSAADADTDPDRGREHGLLGPARRRQLRRDVLEQIVTPCAQRLLARHAASPRAELIGAGTSSGADRRWS